MSATRTVMLPSGRGIGLAEFGARDGAPVLAFHGAPAARVMFAIAHEPARTLGLRLIAPDRPGYGLTPAGPTPHSLASVATDMAALINVMGLDPLGIIGISGGAPYAVATAALLGARVPALALVSPVGPITQTRPAQIAAGHRWFFGTLPRHPRLLRAGARIAASAFWLAPRAFAGAFAGVLGDDDRRVLAQPVPRAALIDFTREALRQGIDGALADLAVFASPWQVEFGAIRARTLLWQGTADRIVPDAAALRLAALIPNCRAHRLEGAGHFWIMEHVAEVLTALASTMSEGA